MDRAMAKTVVTMRVRLGDREIEVTGPSDFVEEKVKDFMGSPARASGSGIAAALTPSGSVSGSAKAMAPGQFLNQANPRTDVARVLVAGFYLEKFRNAQSFTAADVRDLLKEGKRPGPSNTSDAINKNIAKGLMMSAGDRDGGRMAFNLTSDGELEVQEMIDPAK